MSKVRNIDVEETMIGQRVDKWLMREFDGLTFGMISKLMRTGQLRLNGKRLKPNARFVEIGHILRVPPFDPTSKKQPAEKPKHASMSKADRAFVSAMILHEDDEMVALNKPAGLAVQGGSKQKRHVDGLMRDFYAGRADAKLVHRLDRATSGVLLVAKNVIAAARLTAAFRDDQCQKIYWAIVQGNPDSEFEIEAPLLKAGAIGSEKMRIDPDGKYAHTLGRTLYKSGNRALVELKPITGRTHQLRAHMAHISASIIGDTKYGGPRGAFMALHAKAITLPDPATGRDISFQADLPELFSQELERMGYET